MWLHNLYHFILLLYHRSFARKQTLKLYRVKSKNIRWAFLWIKFHLRLKHFTRTWLLYFLSFLHYNSRLICYSCSFLKLIIFITFAAPLVEFCLAEFSFHTVDLCAEKRFFLSILLFDWWNCETCWIEIVNTVFRRFFKFVKNWLKCSHRWQKYRKLLVFGLHNLNTILCSVYWFTS